MLSVLVNVSARPSKGDLLKMYHNQHWKQSCPRLLIPMSELSEVTVRGSLQCCWSGIHRNTVLSFNFCWTSQLWQPITTTFVNISVILMSFDVERTPEIAWLVEQLLILFSARRYPVELACLRGLLELQPEGMVFKNTHWPMRKWELGASAVLLTRHKLILSLLWFACTITCLWWTLPGSLFCQGWLCRKEYWMISNISWFENYQQNRPRWSSDKNMTFESDFTKLRTV